LTENQATDVTRPDNQKNEASPQMLNPENQDPASNGQDNGKSGRTFGSAKRRTLKIGSIGGVFR